MNRLVIIGNGFDLAHDLPTSYKDFVTDYLYKLINKFVEDGEYNDLLFKFQSKHSGNKFTINESESKNFEEAFQSLKNILKGGNIQNLEHSHFFMDSLNLIDNLNWVDFENLYFKYLLKKRDKQKIFSYTQVKNLNSEFEFIKNLFENYLSENCTIKKAVSPHKYSYFIHDKINKEDVLMRKLKENLTPENIQILNFNYTHTPEIYIPSGDEFNIQINSIHGELNNPKNPIIFGFGDEHNIDYKEFETYENNSLFEHIKSFKYLKTKNYYNLIRFLEQDDFQVHILGHSCGLTDRTMLKEIFESEKCVSIKIFYWQKDRMKPEDNDYTERTYEISRHFGDKGLMRKKIVPFEMSRPMS